MSAKLLYSLSDENPDLHKHIGCMNGLIKVFYRQHVPSRRISSHSQKGLPTGPADDYGREPRGSYQKTTERNSKKAAKEKQRVSTELSSKAASFSSSPRASSFSSAEVSIMSQQFELPAFSQRNFNENPVRELPKFQSNASPQWSHRKSLDLREVIKDSIHKETKRLSVKTTTKEDVYGDSSRPLSKHEKLTKARVSLPKETFRAPARNFDERNDSFLVGALKDSPRLSYDDRELRNRQKSAMKLKELPRLSLDSREHSSRSPRADTKSTSLTGDMLGQQEPGSHRRTTSSVVAKLMGLEVLPDSTSTEYSLNGQNKSLASVDHGFITRSAITTEVNRQSVFCDSPRPSRNEATSPRSRNAASLKKSPTSKFPIEPAPWKHPEGGKDQRSATKSQTKGANCTLSVYGEIQMRLAQLEFKKSGKDLRALKQILEAMENTQQTLASRKDDEPSSASLTNENPSLVQRSKQPILHAATATKNFKSSIVIMKPAQSFERMSCSASVISPNEGLSGLHRVQVGNSTCGRNDSVGKLTVMDLTPRPNHIKGHLQPTAKHTNARSLRSKQTSKQTYPIKAEISNSDKSQHTMNPRSQQRRLGSEKHSLPTTPASDSRKSQRRPVRQTESASPRRKHGTKSHGLQQTEDGLNDISHRSDARSLRSESNISSTSNADIEVTSKHRFDRIGDPPEQQTPKQKNPDLGYNPDRLTPEPVKLTLEQPSPVSVLDATFYGDESPSPVRKISTAFKEETPLSSEEAEWINDDIHYLSSFRKLHLSSETLEGCFIDDCDIRNLDHKYISEMLLASGLLRDLEHSMTIVQLNQSRLPINPDLFFVLEQSKSSNDVLQIGRVEPDENIRRKLLFDTVNEVLARNFLSKGSSKPSIQPSVLMDTRPKGQQLLETLWSEICRLQANNSKCVFDDEEDLIWEDLKNQGMGWTTFQGEVPGMVLDIERLIFKDLINEVVANEAAASQGRPCRHHRQLFTN